MLDYLSQLDGAFLVWLGLSASPSRFHISESFLGIHHDNEGCAPRMREYLDNLKSELYGERIITTSKP